MAESELCIEKHKVVNKRLENLENDVDALKHSDAVNTTEIKTLCKNLTGLTKAIWGLVVTVIGGLSGFFIWYVQKG